MIWTISIKNLNSYQMCTKRNLFWKDRNCKGLRFLTMFLPCFGCLYTPSAALVAFFRTYDAWGTHIELHYFCSKRICKARLSLGLYDADQGPTNMDNFLHRAKSSIYYFRWNGIFVKWKSRLRQQLSCWKERGLTTVNLKHMFDKVLNICLNIQRNWENCFFKFLYLFFIILIFMQLGVFD